MSYILLILAVALSLGASNASISSSPSSTSSTSSSSSTSAVSPPPSTPITYPRCRYKTRSYQSTGYFCYMCIVTILQLEYIGHFEVHRKLNRDVIEQQCKQKGPSCVANIDACCEAAEKCCELEHRLEAALGDAYKALCPVTWDDLSCINATLPNQLASIPCPAYAYNFQPNAHAVSRYCQPNGTWVLTTSGNFSWEKTDYMPCVSTAQNEIKVKAIIRLVLSIISMFLLGVSLVLFLGIRTLRAEKRIQVHANLFASLLVQYMLETFINAADIQHHSIMEGDKETRGIYEQLPSCRFIGIGNRFFNSATYTWYVCEAIFLHRQLSLAFENIKSLKFFYLAGWGIPFVVNTIYCIVRFSLPQLEDNNSLTPSRCWLNDLNYLELIHRGPIILGLLINTILLAYILYIVCNLHEVRGDSRSHKRSVKAALILAPLFGLNFAFVCVHWENTPYTILVAVMAGSQGGLVAIIFCFLNHEVQAAFEALRRRHFNKAVSHRTSSSRGGSTQYTAVSQSRTARVKGSVISTGSRADSLPLTNRRAV